MQTKIVAIIVVIILNFLTSAQSSEAFKERIIGKWGNSNDSGQTFWGFDEYFVNGTIISTGVEQSTFSNYRIKSTYEINGDMSCFTVIETSDSKFIPVGYKACDKIVSIDDSYFKFESEGEITTLYRVSNSVKLIGDVPKNKADDIKKLLRKSGAMEMLDGIDSKLGFELTANIARSHPNIPKRVLEKVENEIASLVNSQINIDSGLSIRVLRIYDKHYSHNEIKELIAFYNTPLGKKLASTLSHVTNDTEIAAASWAEKIMPSVIDRIHYVLQSEGYDLKK